MKLKDSWQVMPTPERNQMPARSVRGERGSERTRAASKSPTEKRTSAASPWNGSSEMPKRRRSRMGQSHLPVEYSQLPER